MNLQQRIKEAEEEFDALIKTLYQVNDGKIKNNCCGCSETGEIEKIKSLYLKKLNSIAEDMAKEIVLEKILIPECDDEQIENCIISQVKAWNDCIDKIKQRLETYLK